MYFLDFVMITVVNTSTFAPNIPTATFIITSTLVAHFLISSPTDGHSHFLNIFAIIPCMLKFFKMGNIPTNSDKLLPNLVDLGTSCCQLQFRFTLSSRCSSHTSPLATSKTCSYSMLNSDKQ